MAGRFSRYYRLAARADADVLTRWDMLDACLATLDALTSVAEDGRGHGRVSRAVRAELNLGDEHTRLRHGPDVSAAKASHCAVFLVLLRFRLMHELREFDRERRKEKVRGVRMPRRKPFTDERIGQIVRVVGSQLPLPRLQGSPDGEPAAPPPPNPPMQRTVPAI